jgi:hypothetical protein
VKKELEYHGRKMELAPNPVCTCEIMVIGGQRIEVNGHRRDAEDAER